MCENKDRNLLNILNDYKLRFEIKNTSGYQFVGLRGICELIDNNGTRYYYAMDIDNSTVIKMNQNFEYQSKISINKPAYAIAFDKELFISTDSAIIKTDNHLNILKQYNKTAGYRGIFYDLKDNILYVAAKSINKIDMFDRNLLFLGSINTTISNPYGLSFYNGQLLVSFSSNDTVLVIQNRTIIRQYNNVCNGSVFVSSILVDNYGYMLVLCASSDKGNLYHQNGTYMGYLATITSYPYNFIIDSKGRLIISSPRSIIGFF
jgi:hypothetical protein